MNFSNKQRARSTEDKDERRRIILAAAADLWEQNSYNDLTMTAVAESAGVVKGTVYLYFATKENLFLALLEEMLGGWFDEINDALGKPLSGKRISQQIAEIIVESFTRREHLTRLLGLLEGVLEQNIDVSTASKFKHWLYERMKITGENLENALPFLLHGEGFRLLLHIRAMLAGLRQMADSSEVVREVIRENSALEVFAVDFGSELLFGITLLLDGFKRRGEKSAARGKTKK